MGLGCGAESTCLPIIVAGSHEHAQMPGTVSISAATLYAVVNDIRKSLQASGVHGLLIVSEHSGNYGALFPVREDWHQAREAAGLESGSTEGMHGGELEVLLLLHGAPELIREGIEQDDHSAPERPHLLTLGMADYTKNGIIGQPSLGTAAKGKALLDSLSQSAAAHLSLIAGG
ncbi:hypothetical protein ATKI12_3263 [Kitasatospora sp. Ki12]